MQKPGNSEVIRLNEEPGEGEFSMPTYMQLSRLQLRNGEEPHGWLTTIVVMGTLKFCTLFEFQYVSTRHSHAFLSNIDFLCVIVLLSQD